MEYKQQLLIMDNVDRLLTNKCIKRSTLEDAVGISPGYLSRLKKEGSGASMSLDLLKSIGDYLKVSMDYLMLNASDQTTDENSLIDFFETIYSMSADDNLFWNVFTLNQIDNIDDPDKWKMLGPAVTIVDHVMPEELDLFPNHISKPAEDHFYQELKNPNHLWCILWTGWLSLEKGRRIGDVTYSKATMTDDFFYANIDKIESKLYLYRMEYSDEDGQHTQPDVVEAYLVKDDKSFFLCNSVEGNEFISSKLRDMYQIAKDKSSSTKLDEGARKLLNQFNAE